MHAIAMTELTGPDPRPSIEGVRYLPDHANLKGRLPTDASELIPSSVWTLTTGLRAAALMSDVYEDHKDEDGFLYITYSGENTFGC